MKIIDRTSGKPTGVKDSQGVDILIGDLTHAPGSNTVFQVIDQDGVIGFVPWHTHDKEVAENPKLIPIELMLKYGGIGECRVIGTPEEFERLAKR